MTSRQTTQLTGERMEAPEAPHSAANILDNLGRVLAIGISRREAVGFVLKGLAAAALAQIGVRSAWAAATCPCLVSGQLYDPATACCTATGVEAKNPIRNLAACPGRASHPGYNCVPNGCGSPAHWSYRFIPDSWGAANFRPCCNTHDCCYTECVSPSGEVAKKDGCDTALGTCTTGACNAAYPGILNVIQRTNCLAIANRYDPAVRGTTGDAAFATGQMEGCACCSTSTCPSSCASPGTCAGFGACGPGDCVCGTTPEASGACVHGATPCAGLQPCTASAQCPTGYACFLATCCGTAGVCGPLCSPVLPTSPGSQPRTQSAVSGPTIASRG